MDTGVDKGHKAFEGKIAAEACFSTAQSSVYRVRSLCPNGLDVQTVGDAGQPCPTNIRGCDHGTHVAGVAAGKLVDGVRGIAPGAELISIQVFTLFEDPNICGSVQPCIRTFTSDQLRALRYVESMRSEHEIVAVNMSLGGNRHETRCDATSPLTDIIRRLANIGTSTVIASGNSSFFNAVGHPACVSSAVTVTAVDANGEIDIDYANVSGEVDIAARGTDILAAVPGNGNQLGLKTGTSMAAPAVAGEIAILKEVFPGLTISQLNTIHAQSGELVQDPRTGLSVPIMNLSNAIARAEELGELVALSEDDISPDQNLNSFLNAQRVLVIPAVSSAKELQSTAEEIQRILPSSTVGIAGGGSAFIEDSRGFTPRSIEALKSQFGDKVQFLPDELGRAFEGGSSSVK